MLLKHRPCEMTAVEEGSLFRRTEGLHLGSWGDSREQRELQGVPGIYPCMGYPLPQKSGQVPRSHRLHEVLLYRAHPRNKQRHIPPSLSAFRCLRRKVSDIQASLRCGTKKQQNLLMYCGLGSSAVVLVEKEVYEYEMLVGETDPVLSLHPERLLRSLPGPIGSPTPALYKAGPLRDERSGPLGNWRPRVWHWQLLLIKSPALINRDAGGKVLQGIVPRGKRQSPTLERKTKCERFDELRPAVALTSDLCYRRLGFRVPTCVCFFVFPNKLWQKQEEEANVVKPQQQKWGCSTWLPLINGVGLCPVGAPAVCYLDHASRQQKTASAGRSSGAGRRLEEEEDEER
ncbi:unnamed protein product [Lota lota]